MKITRTELVSDRNCKLRWVLHVLAFKNNGFFTTFTGLERLPTKRKPGTKLIEQGVRPKAKN